MRRVQQPSSNWMTEAGNRRYKILCRPVFTIFIYGLQVEHISGLPKVNLDASHVENASDVEHMLDIGEGTIYSTYCPSCHAEKDDTSSKTEDSQQMSNADQGLEKHLKDLQAELTRIRNHPQLTEERRKVFMELQVKKISEFCSSLDGSSKSGKYNHLLSRAEEEEDSKASSTSKAESTTNTT